METKMGADVSENLSNKFQFCTQLKHIPLPLNIVISSRSSSMSAGSLPVTFFWHIYVLKFHTNMCKQPTLKSHKIWHPAQKRGENVQTQLKSNNICRAWYFWVVQHCTDHMRTSKPTSDCHFIFSDLFLPSWLANGPQTMSLSFAFGSTEKRQTDRQTERGQTDR